ncbi:IS701 family transposase [Phytohabitans sp. ZYX-F-186]|uniref:IS701 family transposase n=1 Tax=Phytohabitans maris TaxID=3071409 RepID=A0ABU0ZVL0_9ACTN|nr:IS701 family transposase [Phytohabitans sp. ZYX-F-186]MDQ7910990.1 IS701 family transposase [Phytohabitans sp. ZYX-F-186]
MDGVCGDELRSSLAEFASDVFSSLRRATWRERSEYYLRCLVLGDKRKRRLRAARAPSELHEQSLNHFVSVSPWDPTPVRRRLSERFLESVSPDAWVLGQTTLHKHGGTLAGVARQDTGVSNRMANCQIGVGVHLTSEDASCPANWRLFLPESWDPALADPRSGVVELRARTGIPEGVGHRRKWQLAVDMLDEMAAWGLRPPVVVPDRPLGGGLELAKTLESRGFPYVVEIEPAVTACPEAWAGERLAVRDIVTRGEQIAPQVLGWRQPVRGQDGELRIAQTRFIFVRVRDPRTGEHDGGFTAGARWLVVEWPSGRPEPTCYWLSDLPYTTPLSQLARLTKLQWRVEHDRRFLADDLGLGRYKGRTWAGWHHHVTLVSAAHAFRTLQQLDRSRRLGQDLGNRRLSLAETRA